MSVAEAYSVAANLMLKGNVGESLRGIISDFERLDNVLRGTKEGLDGLAEGTSKFATGAKTAADKAAQAMAEGADKGAAAQEKASDRAAVAAERAAERAAVAQQKSLERQERQQAAWLANYERSEAEYENRQRDRAARVAANKGHVSSMDVNLAASQVEHEGAGLIERGARAGFDPRYYEYMLTTDNRISKDRAHEAYNAAFDATNAAPGSTPGGNMEALYDVTNVTGDIDEAQASLPQFARLSAVMRAANLHSTGGDDPAYSAAKALEVLGKLTKDVVDPATGKVKHEVDVGQLNQYTEALARVDVQTGGKVGPEDYLKYASMGRVGALNMDDRFTFSQLPALLQVIKGPKTGTAINSASQIFEGGHETEKTMAAMIKYHLADANGLEQYKDPKTGKMKTRVNTGAIHDKEDLAHNVVEYVRHVSEELEKQGYNKTQIENILQEISQRGTVGGQWGDIYVNLAAIDKEEERGKHILAHTADNPDPLGKYLAENPLARTQQLSAAVEKLFAAFSGPMMDPVLSMMDGLTKALNALSNWAKDNPISAKVIDSVVLAGTAIAGAAAVISGAMMIYGPIIAKGRALIAGEAAVSAAASVAAPAASAAVAAAGTSIAVPVAAIAATAIIAKIGSDAETPENRAALDKLAKERRGTVGLPELNDGYDAMGRPIAPKPADLAPPANTGPIPVTVTNPGDLAKANVSNLARQANRPDAGVAGYDGTGSIQPSVSTGLQ